MRKTQTTNGKKMMVITMKKTAPATKLSNQISTISNLNGDLGQSDPMCGNAL